MLKAGRCVAQNPQGGRLALSIFHNIPLSSQKLHLRWMKHRGVVSGMDGLGMDISGLGKVYDADDKSEW